jgi:type IV pilus assembly protein PilO
MGKLSEMSFKAQMGLFLVVALALSGVFYFFQLKRMSDDNATASATLKAKQKENVELRPYRDREKDLERKMASLQQQLEILRTIVPDEKDAPDFMHMVEDTAITAGVEVRRYATKAPATKEFYTEAPFDLELDGPYYALLDFFQRVAKLERIINVSNLQLSTVKRPMDAKVKKSYAYAPGESTVASCVATTFFSHDPNPSKPAAPAGKPTGPAPKQGK